MKRTIRDKFELLLETRNNDIDNTAYHLAAVIVHNYPEASIEETARELLQELAFQMEIHIDHPAVARIIEEARSILIADGFYNGSDTPVTSDEPDEDILEWNARYIGEISDAAEALLVEAGVPTCHPYYGNENDDDGDCSTMCIYCSNFDMLTAVIRNY